MTRGERKVMKYSYLWVESSAPRFLRRPETPHNRRVEDQLFLRVVVPADGGHCYKQKPNRELEG